MPDETTTGTAVAESAGQFTEEEETFIAAAIDVLRATELLRAAEDAFEACSAAALAASQPLGQGRDAMERLNVLNHEAASRAGFGPDSEVVRALDQAYDEMVTFLNAIDEAVAGSITKGTNPVI